MSISSQKIDVVFRAQQTYKSALRLSNAADRIAKLRRLRDVIEKNEDEIYKALAKDLRKSTFETAVTELYFIYGELDFAIKNLSIWMRPKHIGHTLTSPFAKNRIYIEPKGQCLIIAPWNYPFQLTMSPLISAIAAGNCAIVKPSELSPATSKVIHRLIDEAFEEQEIACFEGDAKVATELLKLPFDHIFFTGSTAVGKVVMEAAAKNLSSVTLELGGKSPVIIDQTADLNMAATRIAWGKLVNSGQTCIAPDHVFVHRDQQAQFISAYQAAVKKMYCTDQQKIDPHMYGKIINAYHFSRLKNLAEEAVQLGASLALSGDMDEESHTIAPLVLTDIPAGAKMMEEEIFGPILPILTYSNLSEAIGEVNARNKPLALYIFSNSRKNIKRILTQTSAGGTCINDVLVHISNPKLPFGGVNTSGIGRSHGMYGFKDFSHERAVVFQSKLNFSHLVYPPYPFKNWVLRLLKKIM